MGLLAAIEEMTIDKGMPIKMRAPDLEFNTITEFLRDVGAWKDEHLIEDFYFDLGSDFSDPLYDFDSLVPLREFMDLSDWIDFYQIHLKLSESEKYAFEYLLNYKNLELKPALENASKVHLFTGGAREYVEHLLEGGAYGEISETLVDYLDIERLADDMLRDESIMEFEANDSSDFIVTNAYQF